MSLPEMLMKSPPSRARLWLLAALTSFERRDHLLLDHAQGPQEAGARHSQLCPGVRQSWSSGVEVELAGVGEPESRVSLTTH